MIRVYSQQGPSRSQWALPAGLILLLATLGLALGLIAAKRSALAVELEAPGPIGGGLQAALPAGWSRIADDQLPTGIVLGLIEPKTGRGSRSPRKLLFFRMSPVSPGLPSAWGLAAARHMSLRNIPGAIDVAAAQIEDRLDPIGPFPGCTVHLECRGSVNGQSLYYHTLARAAVTPTGQVFGVVLDAGLSLHHADRELLDDICDQLSLPGEAFTDDARSALAEAGISFTPDASIRAVPVGETGLPRCILAGGKDTSYWTMEIHRLPLVNGRPADQLLTDYAATQEGEPKPDVVIERQNVGGRELLSTPLTVEGLDHPLGYLWATATDQETAVMMIACAEPDGIEAMKKTARDLAARAEVSSYGDIANLELARKNGEKLLDSLRDMDPKRLWLRSRDTTLTYRRTIGGINIGHSTWAVEQDNAGESWIISSASTLFSWSSGRHIEQNWIVRQADLTHTRRVSMSERNMGALRATAVYEYHEVQPPQSDTVECKLVHFDNQLGKIEVGRQFDVGATYTCEPVWLEAIGRLATENNAQPALLSMTEPYGVTPRYWIAVPLGRRPVPEGNGYEEAWVVRLQCDCEATGGLWYFNDAGHWIATVWDNGVTELLVDDDF